MQGKSDTSISKINFSGIMYNARHSHSFTTGSTSCCGTLLLCFVLNQPAGSQKIVW